LLASHTLVFDPMAREGSPVQEVVEAVGAEIPTEVGCQEEHVDSLSIDYSSNTRHESTAASQDEESTIANASEASHSYLFRPSTITVSHIYEMASLRYFVEGDA
jgi:hypothetical protein